MPKKFNELTHDLTVFLATWFWYFMWLICLFSCTSIQRLFRSSISGKCLCCITDHQWVASGMVFSSDLPYYISIVVPHLCWFPRQAFFLHILVFFCLMFSYIHLMIRCRHPDVEELSVRYQLGCFADRNANLCSLRHQNNLISFSDLRPNVVQFSVLVGQFALLYD